jgi:uncharacterized protein (UPF0212 family)
MRDELLEPGDAVRSTQQLAPRALSAAELLDVWERGLTQPPVQRALTLAAAAYPGASLETLANLSIGQRDSSLLTLREQTFGPQLVSLVMCPGCSERLELTFAVADVRTTAISFGAKSAAVLRFGVADYEVSFRLPNSLDLFAIDGSQDVVASRQLLLQRCLLAAEHQGKEQSANQLPAEIVEAVVERMAQADPQADVQLALSCPQCGHQWQAAFDIVSFFWSEIDAWASRLLREVHVLASAYSWREADILALSPWRRQLYLEMISG